MFHASKDVYIPYQKILSKLKKDKCIWVNMQKGIKKAGSFSGVEIELKAVLNYQQCYKAWLNLGLLAYGWYKI